MDIPCQTDALSEVPNNLQICKAIARKVSIRNGELDGKYLDVFKEQEQLGIIVEIPAGFDPSDHKFIPHRPIIRSDPLVNHTKNTQAHEVSTRYNNLAFKLPSTPELPANGVNFKFPFQHTGINYTGHFYIEQNNIKIKTYILIFTCMNSRYVHLEIVNSLTIEEIILVFIRFYNRHGFPSVLYSDNAITSILNKTISKSKLTYYSLLYEFPLCTSSNSEFPYD